jgi:hypothetical protein
MVTAAARLTPAVLVLLLAAGCASHRTVDLTPGPTATATLTPSPTATDTPTATPTADASALTNGKHPVYLTTVDVDGRKLTIDVVQFFTGTAAADAAREDGSAEVPPPNDYWIRNANKLLRTLPIAADATITVNTLAGETSGDSAKDVSVTLTQLAGYSLTNHLFWVTVDGGSITKIAEQFLP